MPHPVKTLQVKSTSCSNKFAFKALGLLAFLGSLLYTLLSLFSYSFSGGSLPSFFRIPRAIPVYYDLRQLTHSSGCDASFADLVANAANCDPGKRPFNYTFPSLEAFRFLGIDASNTELLGAVIGAFGLATALVFIFALVKGRLSKLLLSAAFMLSFPFMLAVERGNHDLLVFGMSLLVPLSMFFSWPKSFIWVNVITSSLLPFSATALKVYPLFGLAPWSLGIAVKPMRKGVKLAAFLLLFSSCIGIFIQLGDLTQIMVNTPKPDGGTSFGLLASYQSRLGGVPGMALTILKVAILAITINIMLRSRFDSLFSTVEFNPRLEASKQAALMFSFMTVLVYLISRSWDYRLIISLGFMPYFLNIFTSRLSSLGRAKIGLAASILFICFEQYVGGLAGIISDVLIQPVLVGFLSAFLWRNYRNTSTPVEST
jgi:hypothetical protein